MAYPTARARVGDWWGSFGTSGDATTGRITSPPFVAGKVFKLWYAGYPSNPGNRVLLRQIQSNAELVFEPPNSREDWAEFELAIPADWQGKQIVFVGIDERKDHQGWFAIQLEPPARELYAAVAALLLVLLSFGVFRFADRWPKEQFVDAATHVGTFIARATRAVWPILLPILFLLRRTSVFRDPSLWAEDGALFLPQYFGGFFESLITPYAGYLHTWIRLWCLPVRWVPFDFVPLYLAMAGFTSFAVIVVHSRIRFEWPTNLLIACCVLVAPVTGETVLNLVNSQWLMSVWPGLVLLADSPTTKFQRTLDRCILLIAGVSGPFCIFWLAPFGLRFLFDRKSPNRRENFAMVALASTIQLALIVATNPKAGPPIYEIVASWSSILATLGRRIMASFLFGHRVGAAISIDVAMCLAAAGFVLLIATALKEKQPILLVSGLAFVLFALSGFLRYPASIALNDSTGAILDRYFLAPRTLWLWFFLMLWRKQGSSAKLGAAIVLVGILLSAGHFFIQDAPPPAHWEAYKTCALSAEGCSVPISPPGWFYPAQPGNHTY